MAEKHTNETAEVTVVIPCYNGEDFIQGAINSVINQSYQNWELVIVDDGSQDKSEKVVRKYLKDKKIRFFSHSNNKGIPAARNTAIRKARGDYIAFLDQDDLWLPRKLEKTMNEFKQKENVGLVQTGLFKKDMKSGKVEKFSKKGYSNMNDKELAKQLFLRKKPFCTASTITVKKSCFERLGYMDERLTRWDDQEMWIRVLSSSSYTSTCIEEPLAIKRYHPGQATANSEPLRDWFRLHYLLMKKYPFLQEYKKKHKSMMYFSLAMNYLKKGQVDESSLSKTKKSLQASIKNNPYQFQAYPLLILSVILNRYGLELFKNLLEG